MQKARADSVQKNSYNELRQDTKHQINNEYRLHKQNIEANINQDPNSFWQFICSKSRSSGVHGEMQLDGSVYSTPGDTANAFAQFFQSVYQVSENHSSFEAASDASSFNLPLVTESDVLVSIKKLKQKNTTGTDNIPAHIYKGLAEFLVKPLVYIFNLSISS
ncbi:hypothetical protein JTB14_032050 [Gonioctena quinquepunctata]|nr:hypothetical protein JTB14_032050 [Gonioctena quinquepunctata]